MARKRFRYSPELKCMVEVGFPDAAEPTSASVLLEIEPFISPRDGTLIKSRSHLRDYMGQHNLVHYDDARTQKAERDRYADERATRQMRERLWEGVSKTYSMGNKPRR